MESETHHENEEINEERINEHQNVETAEERLREIQNIQTAEERIRGNHRNKETIGKRIMKNLRKKAESKSNTKSQRRKSLRSARRTSCMEMSKMKKMRKQTQLKRLKNEKNMKLALQSGGYVPTRSTNITKPKEFNFSRRNESKYHTMETRSARSEKTFESRLRIDSQPHQEFKNENTIPVPFKFSLRDGEKPIGDQVTWESMAQATMKFQTKTPTRFRLKPSKEDEIFLEKSSTKKKQITMPITPQLLTRGRSRRYKIDAAKDKEEKVIEEMRNYRFKATELNPKIMEMKGMYGVKSVPVALNTEQKPFHFEIEERIFNRTGKDSILPLEDSTLEKSKHTTGKLKPTNPKPFSFENKDKERWAKKEERIKEHILAEKKLAEFQATLLPSSSPDVLPDVATKKPTRQKPFDISYGSLAYQSKLDITLKMEAEEERSKRQFKAQSADVVKKKPFQPITGLIPPTNIKNIMMNTDLRAEERERQLFYKMQKEKIIEEEQLEKEKEDKLLEDAAVREFRKNAEFKANPIPNYKPVEIKKSNMPLTQPQTPNLLVKKRALVTRINEKHESQV